MGLLSQVEAARASFAASISTLEDKLADAGDHFDSHLVVCQKRLDAWQSEQSEFAQRESDLETRSSELDEQRSALAQSRTLLATKLRRRLRLLREKAAELAAVEEQCQPLQDELDKATARTAALEKQLADQQARQQSDQADTASIRDELTALRVEDKQLRQQLAESRQLLNDRARRLKAARQQVDTLTRNSNDNDEQIEELAKLRQLRDQLTDELAELKSKIQQQPATNGNPAEVEKLQRKFELAVESLRSVKSRNEELMRELNELQCAQSAAPHQNEAGVEQQVLSQLNTLNGNEDAGHAVEGGTATQRALTDQLLKRKDEQITELETQLTAAQQAPPPAPAEANFAQAQKEWLEKQRAAEVELAVARAQNARTRQELEEKMRDLEANLALARKQRTASTIASENSQRRGWLAHLRRRDEE